MHKRKTAAIVLSALMALALVSCGAKKETAQTESQPVQTEAPAETSVSTASDTVTETEAEETTTAAVETESPQTQSETGNDAYGSIMGDPEKTNGKLIPDVTFAFIDGLRIGMTAEEAKASVGEPGKEESGNGVTILTYSDKTTLNFGDITGTMVSLLTPVEEKSEEPVPALMVVVAGDDTMPGFNGLKEGSTKDEVLDSFCRDFEDNTPDEIKKDGTTILYGVDDYLKMMSGLNETDEGKELDLPDGVSYRLGMVKEGSNPPSITYTEYRTDGVYWLLFELDKNDKVSGITVMYLNTNW